MKTYSNSDTLEIRLVLFYRISSFLKKPGFSTRTLEFILCASKEYSACIEVGKETTVKKGFILDISLRLFKIFNWYSDSKLDLLLTEKSGFKRGVFWVNLKAKNGLLGSKPLIILNCLCPAPPKPKNRIGEFRFTIIPLMTGYIL